MNVKKKSYHKIFTPGYIYGRVLRVIYEYISKNLVFHVNYYL